MPRTRASHTTLVPAGGVVHFVLESASIPEPELIDVGSRYAVNALDKLATTVLPKVARRPGFATYGFGAPWVGAIRALVNEVHAGVDRKRALKDGLLPSGDALDRAVAPAKAWRRRAGTVVKLTRSLRGRYKPDGVGSSVPRLEDSMRELIGLVAQPDTARRGGGEALRAEGVALLAALTHAKDTHTAALASLSPELRALNAKKGQLYDELRALAIAAREVVPAEAKLFAVSTHLRAHYHKRKPAPPPAAAASTA